MKNRKIKYRNNKKFIKVNIRSQMENHQMKIKKL